MKKITSFIITVIFVFSPVLKTYSQNYMVPFPFEWDQISSGKINLSFILDKPAGKNGFIKIENEHFVKPNGERFRIWGVNLTGGACFPEKTEAPKVAAFLAAMGINAVRFHFLDSNWGQEKSIFDYGENHTQSFHPAQVDKLDFFVSELKKQGIYSNFNLNVGRNYREGDNVPFNDFLGFAKGATLFDDRLIELQKDYATQLLTHKNGYTGKEYRNEPALAFIEIVNENSLVEAWFGNRLLGEHQSIRTSTWIDIPVYYGEILTKKYNDWLVENLSVSEIEALRKETGATSDEFIPRLEPPEFSKASVLRFHSEARFIMKLEDTFYSGMYQHLKKVVKVNQLVAANSDHNHYKSGYALLSSMAKLDFVDGHVYWQHPNYFIDPVTGKSTFSIENTPMVNDPKMSTVAQLSRSAVARKPFTVSETNHPYPNEYACEGIVILAAYALLQDWDGIYFYTFEHDDPGLWKSKKPGYFDILHDPVKMAGMAAGSIIFQRADIQSAKTVVLRNYCENDLIEGIRKNEGEKPFFTKGFTPFIPLKYKTRVQSFEGGQNTFPQMNENREIISESGELAWNAENDSGWVTINAKKTQALIGFSKKINANAVQNLKVEIDNQFAALVLTSLDGKDIQASRKLLLTVTSKSILNKAIWNPERTTLTEWGELPFLIEPVTGIIEITGQDKTKNAHVYALNGGGIEIGNPEKITVTNGVLKLNIGKVPTVWYLIELE